MASKERREIDCARNQFSAAAGCRFLCDIGRDDIGYTHGSGKLWEVFSAMAVLSVDLELPPEVVGRLRFPESRARELEVSEMGD